MQVCDVNIYLGITNQRYWWLESISKIRFGANIQYDSAYIIRMGNLMLLNLMRGNIYLQININKFQEDNIYITNREFDVHSDHTKYLIMILTNLNELIL